MTEDLNVSELFYSIQGESTWAGLPCCFIRLAGCNLRCTYCDARYTYQEPGQKKNLAEILTWVDNYPATMVEVTGGEPLLQKNVYPLLNSLVARNRTVLLETNGSVSLKNIPEAVCIICDIKCPASAMSKHFDPANLTLLRNRKMSGCSDNIKFVLADEDDFHWAAEYVHKSSPEALSPVLFSPVADCFSPTRLAELILEHNLPVRLQIQLHTLLWPEKTRGY